VTIILAPNRVLETKTKPVDPTDSRRLDVAASLLIELADTPGALAVAAPQIGSDMRIFAYRNQDRELDVLVNPFIVEKKGKRLGTERCLSYPDQEFRVVRPQSVVVLALTLENDPVRHRWHDLYARMACHEIDHLDGILITDRAIGR